MSTISRRIAPLLVALVALPLLSLLADASADVSENRFGSGVPLPLLAAFAGMPEEAMGWGGMARIDLLPGAETPVLVGAGPILYAVEYGQVDVRSDGTVRFFPAGEQFAQLLTLYGDEMTLGPGDRVLIAAGVSHAINASGLDRTSILATSILPASATAPAGFDNAGIEPIMPFAVALFVAYGGDASLAWPDGVAVATHSPVRIAAGPR